MLLPEVAYFWETGGNLGSLVSGSVVDDENLEIWIFQYGTGVQAGLEIGCAIVGADHH